MNKLFPSIRVFIIIAIIVGIPVGLAVLYSNNDFGQEAEVEDNLLLLAEGKKIEKGEAVGESGEASGEEEITLEGEQNSQESSAEETDLEMAYAPDFSFKDAEGNKISLSNFRGNNILLVFWATWCGYCKKELPDLKNFVEKYGDEIIVLTLVNQESPEVIQEYIEQEKINFSVIIDGSGEIWNSYLVRGTPSHFLIDKEGRVVAVIPGYATKENLDSLASMVIEK